MKASLWPSLSYKAVHGSEESGLYRMFGFLQAIQDDSIVWIANDDVSVSLDISDLPIYILPSLTRDDNQLKSYIYSDESPKRKFWNSIFSLPEKTSFFVSGELIHENGRSKFKDSKENPLLVIIYDCEKADFYSHAILSGRQRNEYWNAVTPGTLTAGSFSLFIYFYILIQIPYMHFVAVTALSFSLVPVLPFFPPGLGFYYIYRHYWKKARILRAERDLLKLPLNFFDDKGGIYKIKSVDLSCGGKYRYFTSNNRIKVLSMIEKYVLRTSSLKRSGSIDDEYYIFSSDRKEKNDPMAESLIIHGNPNVLTLESTKMAQRYEFAAVFSFSIGVIINFFIFITAIIWFIR